jgi:hypothetical protein
MEQKNLKTISQWFDLVADQEIREKLYKNTKEHILMTCVESLDEAINQAFTWLLTPEGSDFWREKVYIPAMDNKLDLVTDAPKNIKDIREILREQINS